MLLFHKLLGLFNDINNIQIKLYNKSRVAKSLEHQIVT